MAKGRKAARRQSVSFGFAGFSERAFLSVVALLAILLSTAAWRVFVAHADGKRAPRAGRVHGAKTMRQSAPRGTLVDRHGRVLARSILAIDVLIECYGNEDLPPELADEIQACLVLDRMPAASEEAAIRRAIELPIEGRRKDLWLRADQRGTRRGPWRFYWKRKVARSVGSAEALRALEELGRKRYPGYRFRLRFESSWKRVYPLGRAAAHVVGTSAVDAKGRTTWTGLEAMSELGPGDVRRWRVLRNARGRAYLRDLDPTRFADEFEPTRVRTALDARTQERAFEAIERAVEVAEADWGMILVLDLSSGDLLALAGAPTYDPEFRIHGDSDWPMTHWACVEPGSVIKPLLCTLAVERGFALPGQVFDCGQNGSKEWRMSPKFARRRRVIRDDHFVGRVPIEDVLVQSSNIGAVKVGMLGGAPLHRELLKLFALGEAPDLGLRMRVGKSGKPLPGTLPRARNFERPATYEVYTGPSLSFGYELQVYPLSFARAFASLVTGADFGMRLVYERERARAPGPGRRILSDASVRWIRKTLTRVVTDPKGTARDLSSPDIDNWLAGKTGTTIDPRRNRSVASFVGFAPADAPRWLSMAVLEKKNRRKFYGGKFAAPAVRDVLVWLRDREDSRSAPRYHAARAAEQASHETRLEKGTSHGQFR